MLWHQLGPLRGIPDAGFSHHDAPARRVQVGVCVHPVVAAKLQLRLRVDSALHGDELRFACEEVSRSATQRSLRGSVPAADGDGKPAAVEADRNAVVVRGVEPVTKNHDVVIGGTCRAGATRPGGGTAPRLRAGPRPGVVARSRTTFLREPRRRGSSARGRSVRRHLHRSRRPSRADTDSSVPPSESWYASRWPSLLGCHASRVVVPVGSTTMGSISVRSVPSASMTNSTACSWSAVRSSRNWRSPRQTGTVMTPAPTSSVMRVPSAFAGPLLSL